MSSPSIHRAQQQRSRKMHGGTVLAKTVVRHPPAGFGHHPRIIALIELDDGSKVLAPLTSPCEIGERVAPRMRFSRENAERLRIYDIAYEPCAAVPVAHSIIPMPRYILALTGPSGVGKSTISRLLVQMCNTTLEPVPILTTRAPKSGDESEYHHVSPALFKSLKERGEIAASVTLPSRSEDRSYGYKKEDIEAIWKRGKLPVVITEMHLLEELAAAYGRETILSCGLLPPGKSKRMMLSALLHRLRSRGRETEEHIADRLKNAEKDLQFFEKRKDLFDHIMVNEDVESVTAFLEEQIAGLTKAFVPARNE